MCQGWCTCLPACLSVPASVLPGGFIKTIIRVLRCVGHFNSKLLVDKVLWFEPRQGRSSIHECWRVECRTCRRTQVAAACRHHLCALHARCPRQSGHPEHLAAAKSVASGLLVCLHVGGCRTIPSTVLALPSASRPRACGTSSTPAPTSAGTTRGVRTHRGAALGSAFPWGVARR